MPATGHFVAAEELPKFGLEHGKMEGKKSTANLRKEAECPDRFHQRFERPNFAP
jgi:hypothetical protein